MELDTSKLLRLQKMSRVLPWIPNITKASKRQFVWHLLWWSSRFLHVFVVNLPVKTYRRLQCLNNHATNVEQCWLKCAHQNFELASAERTGISNEWFTVHGPEDRPQNDLFHQAGSTNDVSPNSTLRCDDLQTTRCKEGSLEQHRLTLQWRMWISIEIRDSKQWQNVEVSRIRGRSSR